MDINFKLNMTFLVFTLLSVLFIKIRSEFDSDPSILVKAIYCITLSVSFIGFIVTSLLRIWL